MTAQNGQMAINKLIIFVCISGIAFIGLNFLSCNFMIPGGVLRQSYNKGTSKEYTATCLELEKKSHDTLLSILTAVIALKTRMD